MTGLPALDPYNGFRWCPVPGCTGRVGAGNVLCGPCWRLASPSAHQLVNDAWLAWTRGKAEEECYLEAIAYAVRSAVHSEQHLAAKHPVIALRRKVARGSRSGRRR